MARPPAHMAGTAQRRPRRRGLASDGQPRAVKDFIVVGIGASAGGLDACRKFLSALPADSGMAFILIQHLDPTHISMMPDLLVRYTSLLVRQAVEGMAVERNHLYVIPPGAFLAIGDGVLHLSQPQARHGARLPFDFLLHSMAQAYGARAACVVLSGTGSDGSLGLRSVKEQGGLVLAQDPDEAGHDGMPRSAIVTGLVDQILPASLLSDALIKYSRGEVAADASHPSDSKDQKLDHLPAIVDLLREKTPHDFTLYKQGTLRRRIERRMGMAEIGLDDTSRYLEILRGDTGEIELLAKDLLINVTSFFRDPGVFDFLNETIVPELLGNHTLDRPLRLWVAGCSTGEEAYSLAMLFREAITKGGLNLKLQVFASDVDPDAVAIARDGLYPQAIEAEVSPARLARFFSKEDRGFRISSDLRAEVVFTVQDVLTDPPFSHIDFVSCRNLLIYLSAEAQAKVISLFHFALRQGGTLLLGASETPGDVDSRFEVISKPERVYRRVGRSRPGDIGFSMGDGVRMRGRQGNGQAPLRQAALAELCRSLIVETYAPAAVLINGKYECLYFLGPTDRYLSVAPGIPTHDLLSMATPALRAKLRAAIQQADRDNARLRIAGGRTIREGVSVLFSIDIQVVLSDGEKFLLICFVDGTLQDKPPPHTGTQRADPRIGELERELEATKAELQGAIRNLEISSEEQKVINEEALSINEEYQSTNEELLTSKEELQSLNEELTALNGQLQETLERQRTTSNDLQNVLYSTDLATIFLDTRLNIRFFTPATRALFNVIPGDVGRPLSDLRSLASDAALLTDAQSVLETLTPCEREIETDTGAWFVRRVLPYRTQAKGIEGVVITFADITERKRAADALETEKHKAELANKAKSRFLAAASHDLRQPLQTLSLLQGLLEKAVKTEKEQKLVSRLAETMGAMSSMLNTLLDINQIEAGTIHADKVDFPFKDLLDRLGDEFSYQAQAQGLVLRTVSCGLSIHSDPNLLGQMIRNLLSNAFKYTKRGKVLLGCRRHEDTLSIEVWDTGVGIPNELLQSIFEEFRQLDNPARNRSLGLGLGLAIVERLGNLLGHRIGVRSQPGKGSVFSIEVMLAPDGATPRLQPPLHTVETPRRSGEILIIEDDSEVRELLELLLKEEGHRPATAPDGVSALQLAAGGTIRPDLILADYNLPNGMDGLLASTKLRQKFKHHIPVIILTGDVSTEALRSIAGQDCIQLNKPVKSKEMMQLVQRLLALPRAAPVASLPRAAEFVLRSDAPTIFVVDDDDHIREEIRAVLEEDGRTVETFASCEAFLASYRPGLKGCLLIDAHLPGMSGLELLQRLHGEHQSLRAIMITGNGDVAMAVQAMKAGALDFIEKPVGAHELLAGIERALELSSDLSKLSAIRQAAVGHIAGLTPRQHQIMDLVLAGLPNKNIAADLGISQRTVENHRASIMKKTGSKSLPALARLAVEAAANSVDEPTERSSPE